MSSLLRGTKAPRGARNSKRGDRGKGAGAADSSTASSKSKTHSKKHPILDAQITTSQDGAVRAAHHLYNKKSKKKIKYSKNHTADFVTSPVDDDPYKAERLGNATKRANLKGTTVNGEGKTNGQAATKQVRFTSPLSQPSASPDTSRDSSVEAHASTQGLSTKTSSSIFTNSKVNFGTASTPSAAGRGISSTTMSPFGAPAGPKFGAPSTSAFGALSTSAFGLTSNGGSTSLASSNPFSKPPSQPSTNGFSGFGAPSTTSNPVVFGSNSFSSKLQAPKSSPTFGAPSTSTTSNSAGFGSQPQVKPSISPFGGNAFAAQSTKPSNFGSTTSKFASTPPTTNGVKFSSNQPRPTNGIKKFFDAKKQAPILNGIPTVTSSKWAVDMKKLLQKNGITPPSWPMKNPGDPSQKGAVEGYWKSYKGYRAKARACLIKNNFIDDPDKPKKLSEAIDFKGTCEEMCPEFEKISRIMESDVKGPEKELHPGQNTPWAVPHKMIKALARSAAGQDAPLPEDVRSPAALRRTLDYLIDEILTEDGLPDVHGFLWDRTRAIRRDFTFQAQSMTTREELLDQVYCLEQITRFHVIALHQMSPRRFGEKITEDFSEQQELEQLGKALLSLTHAYEDCKGYKVKCENEAEFRSYFIVFNAHSTGIMEDIQNWGWEFWGESDQIRTAITIVEALQNTWDTHGPLKPESAAVIAQNAYSKFFSIVQDSSVSYTMACFAEIHFNMVRKSALKTLVKSYRKQRDQTKELTIPVLNEILHFDDEEDLEKFCEAYLLTIRSSGDEEPYLSLEDDYKMYDPFPKLSQLHSDLVERKRGDRSLHDAIHQTIFEEVDDSDSLFIPELRSRTESKPSQVSPTLAEKPGFNWSSPISDQETQKPAPPTQSPFSFPTPSAIATTPPVLESFQPPTGGSPFKFGDLSPKTIPPISIPTPVSTPVSTGNKQPEAKGNTFDFSPKPSNTTSPAAFVLPPTFQKHPDPPSSAISSQNFLTPVPSSNVASSSLLTPQLASQPATNGLQLPTSSSLSSMKPAITPSLPPPAASFPSFGLQHPAVSNAPFQVPEKESSSMQINAPQPPMQVSEPPLESHLPAFAEWFTNGVGGIMDQFLEHEVQKILLETVAQYQREEEERQIKEEEDRDREKADAFRQHSVAVKYCYLWRENAHLLWMRRKAVEGRRMRAERIKELKAAKEAAKSFDIVAEFTKSIKRKSLDDLNLTSSKRRSSEDRLRATGILDFVHDPNEQIKNIVRADSAPRQTERSESPLVIPPAPSDQQKNHKRSKSHRTLLSGSSYLHGGSRSFLLPDDSKALWESTRHNNVKTDYFRLKARGIMTLPNGTPIANSAAVHLLKQKRSFDGITKNVTPRRPIRRPEVRSVPTKPNRSLLVESDDELSQLKERAKGLMNGENNPPAHNKNKRAFDDSDEELFAKAKRIREQMDEGAEWYREEIKRDSLTRSGSGRGSGRDSRKVS